MLTLTSQPSSVFFTRRGVVISLALFMYLLWGSAFPAIKAGYAMLNMASSDFSGQLLFAGIRFTLAGVAILLFEVMTGNNIWRPLRMNFTRVSLLGLWTTGLQYLCFYRGLAHTTGVKGSIMNGTSTFFSVILAHCLLKNERLRVPVLAGCILGFLGVIAVNFQSNFDFSFSLEGEGLLIAAACILAAGGIYGKIISMTMDASIMTGWQLCIGGAALVLSGLAGGGSISFSTWQSVVLMSYLILLSAVAFCLMATLLKYNPVGLVTIFNFTTPVFGAVLSGIFLGEAWLEWKNLLALLCVCAGIFLTTRDSFRQTVKKGGALNSVCDRPETSLAGKNDASK